MTLDETTLREWLRENLVVDVELDSRDSPRNSVVIGLRFNGEWKPFGTETVYIPED